MQQKRRTEKMTLLNDGDVFWEASPEDIENCNLTSFVKFVNDNYGAQLQVGDQTGLHRWSVKKSATFWHSFAKWIDFPLYPFPSSPESVITAANVPNLPSLVNVHWFRSSLTNFAHPFLQQSKRYPDKTCIISISEHGRSTLTFKELHDRVTALSTGLYKFGIRAGATLAAVISNNDRAVVSLLSSTLMGCSFASCSPDFGIDAIVSRFEQLAPTVLFFSPIYYHKLTKYDIRHKILAVCQRLPSIQIIVSESDNFVISTPQRETRFRQFTMTQLQGIGQHHLDQDNIHLRTVETLISMRDPVITMFSSGTTGRPKCIVQGVGILLNQMKELSLHFDIDSSTNARLLYVSSTSWMMFNWSLSALALGAQIVLYDGCPQLPNDPLFLLRLVIREQVTHFGCGASLIRAFSQATDSLHLSVDSSGVPLCKQAVHLRSVLATGSPSTAQHFSFVKQFFPPNVKYVSMSGGSDINGCFVLGSLWKPIHVSQIQCAGLGMDVVVLDDQQNRVVGATGELCCRNACPCMPLFFLNDELGERYRSAYFEFGDHAWKHGDFALESEQSSFVISGRSDATMNANGIRIGTADIYQIVEDVDFITDSLVVDVPVGTESGSNRLGNKNKNRLVAVDSGSTVMVLFVVFLKRIECLNEGHVRKLRHLLRVKLSPRHVPRVILQVSQLPYTFSGKKCEIPVKKLLMGKDINNKEAVKNPESFDEIVSVFEQFLSRQRISKL